MNRLHRTSYYRDKQWKMAVLMLDNWTCQFPGCLANTHLDAAHIIPRSHLSTRYDPANGVTLCRGHHEYFHAHPPAWRKFTETFTR
jgi:predicted restriction endonuclease